MIRAFQDKADVTTLIGDDDHRVLSWRETKGQREDPRMKDCIRNYRDEADKSIELKEMEIRERPGCDCSQAISVFV